MNIKWNQGKNTDDKKGINIHSTKSLYESDTTNSNHIQLKCYFDKSKFLEGMHV